YRISVKNFPCMTIMELEEMTANMRGSILKSSLKKINFKCLIMATSGYHKLRINLRLDGMLRAVTGYVRGFYWRIKNPRRSFMFSIPITTIKRILQEMKAE